MQDGEHGWGATRLEVLCVLVGPAVEFALRLDLAFYEVDVDVVVDANVGEATRPSMRWTFTAYERKCRRVVGAAS